MTTEDLARLTTDDIASFSIMKDANATALYGARGANGVILVSTKEGKEGKVSISVKGGASVPGEDGSYPFRDEVLYSLPSTGGIGIYWYLVSGTLLMLASALTLYRCKRKSEGEVLRN